MSVLLPPLPMRQTLSPGRSPRARAMSVLAAAGVVGVMCLPMGKIRFPAARAGFLVVSWPDKPHAGTVACQAVNLSLFMTVMNIAAIVLAAGLSRRMGKNKLLLPFGNSSLLGRSLALVASLPYAERILVTTEQTLQWLEQHEELPPGFRTVINHAPEEGQAASLRLGTEASGADGYMYFTGDQPLLHRDVVLALLERASPEHIVVPRAGGRPASPVFFPARFRAELLQRRGDEGGRGVRDAHPEACLQVEMPDPRILADIDTPEQYEALLREEQPRE